MHGLRRHQVEFEQGGDDFYDKRPQSNFHHIMRIVLLPTSATRTQEVSRFLFCSVQLYILLFEFSSYLYMYYWNFILFRIDMIQKKFQSVFHRRKRSLDGFSRYFETEKETIASKALNQAIELCSLLWGFLYAMMNEGAATEASRDASKSMHAPKCFHRWCMIHKIHLTVLWVDILIVES